MTPADIEAKVWDAIRKTINKFREQPYYFFTESDIVSYLWMSLYSSQLVANTHDNRPVYLVHREYPTNFRYDKKKLLEMEEPYPLIKPTPREMALPNIAEPDAEELKAPTEPRGTRGNYDLVILNPSFVQGAPSIEDIVNKSVRHLEIRHDPAAEELLFAIEFKYIINSSSEWENQILSDNKKLLFAKRSNVKFVVNLVFCNTNPTYLERFKTAVVGADHLVYAAFIQSHYDTAGVKLPPPRPIANTAAALAQIGY